MNATAPSLQRPPLVRCRELTIADREIVADLLAKGFARWRTRAFWTQALDRLHDRVVPAGLPQLGYGLEVDGHIVGVLLMISSEAAHTAPQLRRCNVSSWYVEPEYRIYGSMLVNYAVRHRDVVYMNVTPAPETWPLLAAQGYRTFVAGRAVTIPLLARRGSPARVAMVTPNLVPGPDLDIAEVTMLHDHHRWDCLSLVCTTETGRIPFIFGRRTRRGLPYAYLIYCRSVDDVIAHARPLGRFLARHAISFIIADADHRLPGMPGWFQPGFPKYFKGAHPPRPGDLAYTERAIFGV